MAKIELEGHLLGIDDVDPGLWRKLALNGGSLAHLISGKLDGKTRWDDAYDYGRVRITIEQLEEKTNGDD